MPERGTAERRASPRAPIELRVEYRRVNAFFADYAKNIGRGGIFVRTERPLEVGTEFRFELHVPAFDGPLALRGRVQWVVHSESASEGQEPGMEIAFLYESEAERQRVARRVERLLVEQLGAGAFEKLLGRKPTF
ncbi:MAG: TIGR02266 family protein [Myxococcota bacterium]|nr:TIGR02266 family protein [Myxococcota bacterium]MDW8362666.1 TIGR02266 family protein [Myxococcales bacterium]